MLPFYTPWTKGDIKMAKNEYNEYNDIQSIICVACNTGIVSVDFFFVSFKFSKHNVSFYLLNL